MYTKLPNLVVAFHGCDESVLESVVSQSKELKASTNDYDWLGHGVYFWEQNHDRAFQWACECRDRGRIDHPAVIGSVIDLGHCLNLTDSSSIDLLKREYEMLKAELDMIGQPLPRNIPLEGSTDLLIRRLDCAVVEHLHESINAALSEQAWSKEVGDLRPFDSVRGVFIEGEPLYENSGFYAKSHIQICVRNPNCIKGYFIPRKKNSRYDIP